VTREEIINEIRRVTTSNGGKPLGLDAFKRTTGIRESDWPFADRRANGE